MHGIIAPMEQMIYKAPSISGPSTICSQGTYTINNLPEGATVQWSVNIPYVTLQPGQDSVIVQKTGSGFINLTASIFINGTLITTIVKEDILTEYANDEEIAKLNDRIKELERQIVKIVENK